MKKSIFFVIMLSFIVSCSSEKNQNLQLGIEKPDNQQKNSQIWEQENLYERNEKQEKSLIPNKKGFIIKDPRIAVDQKDTIFYLVQSKRNDMSGDISRYLIPIKIKNQWLVNIEDKIANWLWMIFSIKTRFYNTIWQDYEENTIENMLYKSDVSIKDIDFDGEQFSIYLSGSLISQWALMSSFIKPQINKTIQEYTKSYKVFLNGSEEAWKCALDTSWECK